MVKDTRVSSISDTLNFGKFVVDIRNRVGDEGEEDGDVRSIAADRTACP